MSFCLVHTECPLRMTRVVTNDELGNARYLRGAKRSLADLNIPNAQWRPTLIKWHNTYDVNGGVFLDETGAIVELCTDVLSPRDLTAEELQGTPPVWDEHPMPDPFPEWAGDFAVIVGPWVNTFVMESVRERARVMITLAKARFPGIDRCWDCGCDEEMNFLI